MPIDNDIELVRRFMDRELDAQDEFALRCTSICKRVARGRYRLLPDQVDDLCQKFILNLIENEFRRLSQWNRESPLDAWLRKSANNLCIDYVRSSSRMHGQEESRDDGRDPLSVIPNGNPGPYDSVNVYSKEECVRKAMEGLSARDQRLIELWIAGHSYREIAELLDLKLNNAGVAINRAVGRLRQELRRLCPDYANGEEV